MEEQERVHPEELWETDKSSGARWLQMQLRGWPEAVRAARQQKKEQALGPTRKRGPKPRRPQEAQETSNERAPQTALRSWFPELEDPAQLFQLYHEEGRTLKEVARKVGCSIGAVQHAMEVHNIPRRRAGPRIRKRMPDLKWAKRVKELERKRNQTPDSEQKELPKL